MNLEFTRPNFSKKNLGGLKNLGKNTDPLKEEKKSPMKGLIHRYPNRVLILLTLNCAAYCRFCFRRRIVSDIEKGILSNSDLDKIVSYIERSEKQGSGAKRTGSYIKKHPKVNEVMISGGDSLTQPKVLEHFLKKISHLKQIEVMRIGTRLPVSDPKQINSNILRILKLVKKQPLYLLLHFEFFEAYRTLPDIFFLQRFLRHSCTNLSFLQYKLGCLFSEKVLMFYQLIPLPVYTKICCIISLFG